MKYELIKKYPGSPELGTIESCSTHIGKGTKFYNSHPEFWQKVEEFDYEILNYRDYNGTIFEYFNNGFAINSVKRLSDGEVFTIGDLVDFVDFGNKGFQQIERFEIDYFDKTRITAYNSAYGMGIVRWKKVPVKTPLFTTEQENEIINIINKYR